MSDHRDPPPVPDQTATEAEAPEASTSDAEMREPDAREPDASEPDAPEPNAPERDAPEPDPSEPDPSEPEVPEPDAPEPGAPEADAPEVDVPDAPDVGMASADPVQAADSSAEPGAEPSASSVATAPILPDEEALRIAEALVFASAAPVLPRALSQILPMGMDPDAVIDALRARYAGRGVELVDAAGGVQFRTAQDVAPKLRKVIEVPRRLPRVAMETLAIIAYHQPVTRPEIEEIRGASLSQQTLDALLEANLVIPKGRRESPGRPTLWGTTPQFLTQFGLQDIRDLPRRDDLLVEPPMPAKAAAPAGETEAGEGDSDSAPEGGDAEPVPGTDAAKPGD